MCGGGKGSEAQCVFQRPDGKRKLVKWLKQRASRGRWDWRLRGGWREKRDDSGADSVDAVMKGEMERDEKQKEDRAKTCNTMEMMKSKD